MEFGQSDAPSPAVKLSVPLRLRKDEFIAKWLAFD
jgi:hypothetical protein